MKLSGNTVLITGGGSGIGLALAEKFLIAGSKVIICGRRKDKLDEVKRLHPGLRTIACDVSLSRERVSLFEAVTREFPGINVLVNNAGIQRRVRVAEPEPWEAVQEEIAINLEAPLHLSKLFVPFLLRQSSPAILNVTSGLAFSPLAFAPVYCATKSALRSFTLSLRYQLKESPIKVVEIIPPAVNTDLGGKGLHDFGAPLVDFTEAVVNGLERGDQEITFGMSQGASRASREQLDEIFVKMNASMPG